MHDLRSLESRLRSSGVGWMSGGVGGMNMIHHLFVMDGILDELHVMSIRIQVRIANQVILGVHKARNSI